MTTCQFIGEWAPNRCRQRATHVIERMVKPPIRFLMYVCEDHSFSLLNTRRDTLLKGRR